MSRATLLTIAAVLGCALGATPKADAYIYWTDQDRGAVGRADLDGTHVTARLVRGLRGLAGLAVDRRFIFWLEVNRGCIGRSRIDGSGVDRRLIASADLAGTAPGVQHLYGLAPTTATSTSQPATSRAIAPRSPQTVPVEWWVGEHARFVPERGVLSARLLGLSTP